MLAFVAAYLLGGLTFIPLVLVVLYAVARMEGQRPRVDIRHGIQNFKNRGNRAPINGGSGIVPARGDAEARGWLLYAESYIALGEAGDPTPTSKTSDGTARSSLQKFVKTPAASSSTSGMTSNNSNTTTLPKVGSVSKMLARLPRYWAVVRGGQLQLFADSSESQLIDWLQLTEFVVTMWPQNLQEFEIFYRRHPICLVSRTGRHGLVSLDMDPGVAPQDAFYFYCENPWDKEDIYFALVKESRTKKPDESLGPRDPCDMAQPIVVSKVEKQELQSRIWSTDQPRETQWLNAMLGRLFLGIKDSRWIDDYLRRKITYKMRPVTASSPYIGPIEVLDVFCGSSIPYVTGIKLRELTPEGNLVVEAGISYHGGFCVSLATTVNLAVGGFRAAEIPVELACTVRELEGTAVFQIKPAPSSRIWYAFDTMPHLDLLLEPVVYDTRISYSFVTNYLKNQMLEVVKETMVMPFMDDLSFYNTSAEFYRGGIWDFRFQPAARSRSKAQAEKAEFELARAPPVDSSTRKLRRGGSSASSSTLKPSTFKESTVEPEPDHTTPSSTTSSGNSTVRRISQWVKRKRSSQSLRPSPPVDEANSVNTSTTPPLPGFVGSPPRPSKPATSAVTAVSPTAPVTATDLSTAANGEEGTTTQPQPSRSRSPVRRKPIPIPSEQHHSLQELPELEHAESEPVGSNDHDPVQAATPPNMPPPRAFPSLASSSASASIVMDNDWRRSTDSTGTLHHLRQVSRSSRSSSVSSGWSAHAPIAAPTEHSSSPNETPTAATSSQAPVHAAAHASSGRKPVLPPRRRKRPVLATVAPEPDRD